MAYLTVDSTNTSGTYTGGRGATPVWTSAARSLSEVASNVQAGDIILCDDGHDYDPPSTVTVTFPANVTIKSVDKATNLYSPGASELSSVAGVDPSYRFRGSVSILGMTLGNDSNSSGFPKIECDFANGGTYYGFFYLQDCTFKSSAYYDEIYLRTGTYGGTFKCYNCTFEVRGTAAGAMINSTEEMQKFEFYNCTFSHPDDSDTDWTIFVSSSYGEIVLIEDSDLSKFNAIGTNGIMDATLRRCKILSTLKASSALGDDLSEDMCSRLLCLDCSTGTVSKTLSQLTKSFTGPGTCEHDDTISRASAGLNDGEESYSIKMTPSNTYSICCPLELPVSLAVWHNAGGNQTLKVYFASDDSALLDDEVWVVVSSNDSAGTPTAVGEYVNTRGTGQAAGTSTYLKTGTFSEWNEGTGPGTAYQIEVPNINPTEPGLVYVRFFLMYTGSGYDTWVDPAITLT